MNRGIRANGRGSASYRRAIRDNRVYQRSKVFQHPTYRHMHVPADNRDDYFITASDLTDFTSGKILKRRIELGYDTVQDHLKLLSTRLQFEVFWNTREPLNNFQLTEFSKAGGMLITAPSEDGIQEYVKYSISNSGIDLQIAGSTEFVEEVKTLWLANFEVSTSNIEWIYSPDGSSVSVALRKDRNPVSEMYSFLDEETLEDYYDRFMNSNASILLLIGPPGTGKTSFIRGLLQHTNSNAILTYDPQVLAKDYVFAQFIEGDSDLFIIEDADTLLHKRSDGNDMMHKFLNVGDGLVTTVGKKMIFSTNLPSIKDVDAALIRPGRCFDILNFENLPMEKVEVLCKKLNLPLPAGNKKNYSLAEVFHTQTATVPNRNAKMGF